MKISNKLFFLYLFFCISMSIVGYVGLNNLYKIGNAFSYLQKDPLLALSSGQKMNAYNANMITHSINYLRTPTIENKKNIQDLLNLIDQEFLN